ncbi:MAG: DUF896 domain-containing protein [Firmicutes bacterium]|nr:DUF896 domain-containing protein [Bacillota bacterium]
MNTKELIDKINILARKQKKDGLTEEEKAEQQRLRKIYLKGIRQQVVDQLEASGITKEDKKKNNDCSCGCTGHDHNHKH